MCLFSHETASSMKARTVLLVLRSLLGECLCLTASPSSWLPAAPQRDSARAPGDGQQRARAPLVVPRDHLPHSVLGLWLPCPSLSPFSCHTAAHWPAMQRGGQVSGWGFLYRTLMPPCTGSGGAGTSVSPWGSRLAGPPPGSPSPRPTPGSLPPTARPLGPALPLLSDCWPWQRA